MIYLCKHYKGIAYNERQKVNVEAYFNGKPATDTNIVKGVQNMVEKALKKLGRRK